MLYSQTIYEIHYDRVSGFGVLGPRLRLLRHSGQREVLSRDLSHARYECHTAGATYHYLNAPLSLFILALLPVEALHKFQIRFVSL